MSTLSHESYIEWVKYRFPSIEALMSLTAYANLPGSRAVFSFESPPELALEGIETGGLFPAPG